MIAITSFLHDSYQHIPLPGKPSIQEVNAAREAGVIDVRAATLLKAFDHGASGLTKDETALLRKIWGAFRKGYKFPQASLAPRFGITTRSLKTQLSRWRKRIQAKIGDAVPHTEAPASVQALPGE